MTNAAAVVYLDTIQHIHHVAAVNIHHQIIHVLEMVTSSHLHKHQSHTDGTVWVQRLAPGASD